MIYQKLDRLKFGILLFGIFVSSFGVLAFEISLTRIFSVMLDYHYTFLIISMALFGLGIGGLFAQGFSSEKHQDCTFSRLALMGIGFSFSTAIFVVIAISFPNLNLILAAFLVFLPFSIAGMLLATCYKVFVTHSNVLHFADLGGAAIGALASVLLLNWVGAVMEVLALSVATSLASLFFALASRKKTVIIAALLALTVMATFVSYSNSLGTWTIEPSNNQEKELAGFLSDSSINAQIVDSRWSSFGQVDVVGVEFCGESAGEGGFSDAGRARDEYDASLHGFLLAHGNSYCLRTPLAKWAGELVCGFRTLKAEGSEETPPTRRTAVPHGTGREPWQQSRNDTSAWTGDDALVTRSVLGWNGETAVLQVERANRR